MSSDFVSVGFKELEGQSQAWGGGKCGAQGAKFNKTFTPEVQRVQGWPCSGTSK